MIASRSFLADHGVVDGRLVARARYDVDDAGDIVAAGTAASLQAVPLAPLVRDFGRAVVLPGLVDAHSHAFQRSIRGATHQPGSDDDDFWSWRTAMYEAAGALDPDGVYARTRECFAEMLHAGITCVGEFHYLHHRVDGSRYDEPDALSLAVVEAASSVGIRLVLLECYYERAGAGAAPLPEQRRFCDGSVADYLARIERLRERGVTVGIAPHSVRAVPANSLRALARYANEHALPLHAHVSEQPRENEQCAMEHGCSPLQLLQRCGALERSGGFTAVHAIHVDPADRALLAGHTVCACPTTEADLGDGIVPASDYVADGVALALGSDSNTVIDLLQEARWLELGDRWRTRRRIRLASSTVGQGERLLRAATRDGAAALGRAGVLGELAVGRKFDAAILDRTHPVLRDVPDAFLLDATMLAATAALVVHVVVAGQELVS
ncbi:MAG: formimidoylglutamate deiminase [Nannocystaceae bacterium]|nr:formimidoylglutamate deiminase [Nannocystaceae bacterium]